MKHIEGKWAQRGKWIKRIMPDSESEVIIAEVMYGGCISTEEADAVGKLIVKAPELLRMTIGLQKRLEMLINATPSGAIRDLLTQENIEVFSLINELEELSVIQSKH